MRRGGLSLLLAAVALTVPACGGGAGGTGKAATISCVNDDCTITYPAKARNNQASTGGPPADVLGVRTQLASISQGQALIRVGETPLTLKLGKKAKAAGLTVELVEFADDRAVVRYRKG